MPKNTFPFVTPRAIGSRCVCTFGVLQLVQKREKKGKKKIEEISSVRLWENQMASIRTDVAPLSFFLSCSLRDFVRATSFSIDGGVSTARPPL